MNNYVHKSVNKIVVNDERIARFVAQAVGSDDFTAHGTIGVLAGRATGEEILAGIVYDNFNGANICMHVGAKPGVNWVSRKLLHLAFDYPFRQLGCRRVTGLVPESNVAARRFNEHLGFKVEARIRAGAMDGDVLIYAMFREECRFLQENTEKTEGNVTNWSHSRGEKRQIVGFCQLEVVFE